MATKKLKASSEQKKHSVLTPERLRELLHYDPVSGVFTWRQQKGRQKAAAIAGSVKTDGYREIGIDGVLYYAHRLAWLYVHGHWPVDQLDHRNGDEDDNKLSNLRECNNAENCQNLGLRKNNRSGATGVYWNEQRQKWQAQIRDGGRIRPLGRFQAFKEARSAYLAAKAAAHQFQPTPRNA